MVKGVPILPVSVESLVILGRGGVSGKSLPLSAQEIKINVTKETKNTTKREDVIFFMDSQHLADQ